jgi:hypothetical protein
MAIIAPVIAFVFRPNGTAGGNVYTDWSALMVQLNKVEGRKILEFDDSTDTGSIGAPCAIPRGIWNMRDVVWAGYGPRPGATRSVVVIQEGAVLKELRMIGGQITIDNQATVTSPISDFADGDGGANHIQIGMRDDCGNTQIFNSGDAPLFDLGTGAIGPNGLPTRLVFFFVQNALLGIRQNPDQASHPLITHNGVKCFINFIGQNQTGNNLLKSPAKALFGAMSSSTLIGTTNIVVDRNPFGPVTRIQRKVQPQPPAPAATSMMQIGEIALPNVLLRCDGGTSWASLILRWLRLPYFLLTLPNIKDGFKFSLQDPTPLYTGGQEIVVAEIVGGYSLQVSASPGNTIDGSSGSVLISPHGSRTFASDGEDNWITTARH